MARRRFGRVRQLPSGRWQARYRGADGLDHTAPHTFERRADADRWLAQVEADLVAGDWINPDAGLVWVDEFATLWISQRAGLRPKTLELYRWLLHKHIGPGLGQLPLSAVSAARVRTWRAELLESGVSASTTAKAYRLLRTVMQTAVDDRPIRTNPCRIRGAAAEHPDERPTLSVAQVMALANAMPSRYRLLVLMAAFVSLRFGELSALQRRHIDAADGYVHVRVAAVELSDGSRIVGPPKTAAGRRTVAIPSALLPDMRRHLAQFTAAAPESLVFAGPKGAGLRRSNFQKWWRIALDEVGLEGVHFHDLRHTGSTLTAQAGATMSDLMARMGHSSTRAAQIYLHTTTQRDRVVADALNSLIEAQVRGTQGARDPDRASGG